MQTEQKGQQYKVLEAFKKWLFPPQPLPHIFLNLVTTENWRSPNFQSQSQDSSNLQIIASLQINRHEVVPPTRIGCTQDLIANFGDWYENYTKYAIDHDQYALRDHVSNTGERNNSTSDNFRRFEVNEDEEASISTREYSIEEASARVERSINYLFNQSNEFQEIRDQLVQALPPKDQPQPNVYIRYDNPLLAELPLHLWDEFQERNIEPVFCSLKTSLQNISFKKKRKPRILLILGDFVDIDNENEMLNWRKKYPDAEIEVLELLNQKGVSEALWKGKWDILYFGGHSTTQDGKGIIYLKDDRRITLGDFKKGLAESAKNGLQLAIFNSCISLGAAADLQSAGVPMVVATRHKMHNLIAPEFLEYFLDAYINADKSIKDAVWYARERLKTDTPYFPCANWLPVVFQIPTVISQPKPSPLVAIATSFFVTCLVFFLHTQGIFQAAELSLYDHMMNSRQAEPLDPRIVLIHIDKQDQEWQESRGAKLGHESIDNEHLAQLLKRLDEEKPKVIGMTLERRNPKNNDDINQVVIDKRMLSDSPPTLIANCSFESQERGYFPEAMREAKRERKMKDENLYPYGDPRIGFTNIAIDSRYTGNVRRLLLMQNLPNSDCGGKALASFPLRIVLAALDIQDKDIEVDDSNDRFFLKFKNVQISNIVKGQGGYQVDPSPSGNDLAQRLSILFNFRNNISNIAPISLKSILTRKNISLKDKIVIIGGIGKDANENIKNIYFHTLAVDYLLKVFEGSPVLKGVNNDMYYFTYCYISILLLSLLVHYVYNSFRQLQFFIFFFAVTISTLAVSFINFKILENFAIWVPYIPVLVGILASSLILSIYYQNSDLFIYKNQ